MFTTKLGCFSEIRRSHRITIAGWWFQSFFMFTPKIGEDEPILTHIFQRGLKPPTSIGFFMNIIGNYSVFMGRSMTSGTRR